MRPASNHEYCTFVCSVIDEDLARAHRLCAAIGSQFPETLELWAEIVTCADAWSRYKQLDRELFDTAKASAYSWEQWNQIKQGTY